MPSDGCKSWATVGLAVVCLSCTPPGAAEPPSSPAVPAPLATVGQPPAAASGHGAAEASSLCGMPLKNPSGAQMAAGSTREAPVVQVAGEYGTFEIDNRSSAQLRSCAFTVAGPSVGPQTVFFGYGALRAPAGRIEGDGAGRVRVTYPVPAGSYGLVSVEPAVAAPADPYRFEHGALRFELTGAALLRFEDGQPRTRALGPAITALIENGGFAAARIDFFIDNVSVRLSSPAVKGLSGATVSPVEPLGLRVRGTLAPGSRARFTLAAKALPRSYDFLFGGDIRGNTALFANLVQQAKRQHDPLFVVTSGDYTDNALPHELTAYVRSAASLGLPVYPVVGNHDLHTQGVKHYARWFGPRRYSFTVGNALFVVLDSNESGDGGFIIGEEQFAWLEQTLSRHRSSRHKFIALHAPPDPLHKPSPWGFYPANLAEADAHELRETCARHRVAYVLAGHVHLYARGEQRGTVYLTSGGGGAHLSEGVAVPGFEMVSEHHVMVLQVHADQVVEQRIRLPAQP